jgi:hypothetical protein
MDTVIIQKKKCLINESISQEFPQNFHALEGNNII